MPYVPGASYVDGVELDASTTEAKNKAARKYLNVDIVAGDIEAAAFDTDDIQAGEPFGVVDDHIFATGDQYSTRKVKRDSLTTERRYHSATIKDYDPQIAARYQSVPDLAREFYMEDGGYVMVEIGFYTKEDQNDATRAIASRGSVGSSGAVDSKYYLSIDGVVDTTTIAHAFEETNTIPTSQSSAFGLSIAGGFQNRKYITFFFQSDLLSQGWHTIAVVVDPRNEKGFVSHRMFNLEIFYNGGFNAVSATSIGTNRPLSSNIF